MRSITPTVLICALLAAICPSSLVRAQPYSSGPITFVVPFPPGGATDVVARLISVKLDPSVKAKVTEQGADVVASSPQEFAAFVNSEIVRWRDVVRLTGARLD